MKQCRETVTESTLWPKQQRCRNIVFKSEVAKNQATYKKLQASRHWTADNEGSSVPFNHL